MIDIHLLLIIFECHEHDEPPFMLCEISLVPDEIYLKRGEGYSLEINPCLEVPILSPQKLYCYEKNMKKNLDPKTKKQILKDLLIFINCRLIVWMKWKSSGNSKFCISFFLEDANNRRSFQNFLPIHKDNPFYW